MCNVSPKRRHDAELRLIKANAVTRVVGHYPVVAGHGHQTASCRTGALWGTGGQHVRSEVICSMLHGVVALLYIVFIHTLIAAMVTMLEL